jgi:hypothetical protein
MTLDASPANVLMFNMSPGQGLRQTRGGRSFSSDMLRGEFTLMPRGVPSQWSWNSVCDRLDVVISAAVFDDGSELEVVDRFLFRDSLMEAVCHRLFREVSLDGKADGLFVETLTTQLAELLMRNHSTASNAVRLPPASGLTRYQARQVLDYIESNLSGGLTLGQLASVAGLSVHHFAYVQTDFGRGSPPVRARVLARAFVGNPLNIAAFGQSALDANEAFFRSGLEVMKGTKLVAVEQTRIVGVVHWADSPGCRFSGVEKLGWCRQC